MAFQKNNGQEIKEDLNFHQALEKCSNSFIKKPTVAFIDTGCSIEKIDPAYHSDIRLLKINKCNSCIDVIGHGTMFLLTLLNYFPQQNIFLPKILSIKAGDSPLLNTGSVIESFKIALSENADIISINVCNAYFNHILAEQIYTAYKKNVITVAPAGNLINMIETFPSSLSSVIGTTSHDEHMQIVENVNVYPHTDIASREDCSGLKHLLPDFDSILQGKRLPLFGTSLSLPVIVACISYMKAVNPLLNVDQIRDVFANFLSNKIKCDADGRTFYVPGLKFDEALNGTIQKRGYLFEDEKKIKKLFFELDNYNDNSFTMKVYSQTGNPVLIYDIEVVVNFYRFETFKVNKKEILFQDSIIMNGGEFTYKFDHMPKGKYMLQIKDQKDSIVTAVHSVEVK